MAGEKAVENILDKAVEGLRKYITRYHNTDTPENVASLMELGVLPEMSSQGAFFTSVRPVDMWNSKGPWRVQVDIPKEEYSAKKIPNPVHGGSWDEIGKERSAEGFNSFGAKFWRNYHNVDERGRVDTFKELSPDDFKKVCVDVNYNEGAKHDKDFRCWDVGFIRKLAKERNDRRDDEFMEDSIAKTLEELLVNTER